MLKRLTYLFVVMLPLVFALQATGQAYIIEKVCVGSERQYRVIGESGSSYEWLLSPAGSNLLLPDATGTAFNELDKNGFTVSGNQITIRWNQSGNYKLSVIQTSFLKCDTLEQGQVEVYEQPIAIAGKPLTICSGTKVELNSAFVDHHSSFVWSTAGDGYFDNPNALVTAYNGGPNDQALGKVELTLTAQGLGNTSTCTAAESSLTATFKPLPKMVVTNPESVCSPQTINLSDKKIVAGSDADLVYAYYSDAYATIPLLNYTTISQPGTYYIKGTNANDCSVLKPVQVLFDELYVPSFASVDELCLNSTPDPLPPSSFNGITGKWNPATILTSSPGTTTYTFTPDPGQCAAGYSIDITVSNSIVPRFSYPTTMCLNEPVVPLPEFSSNGIQGTWSPAVVSTSSIGPATYRFTPVSGSCGVPVDLTIQVGAPASPPTFNFLKQICLNSTPPKLPTVSVEGVSGTWEPNVISTSQLGPKDYVFTPFSGQCVQFRVERITIIPKTVPQFAQLGPFCLNSVPVTLPKVSSNGVSGTWLPATVNTSKSGKAIYNFTPDDIQCNESTSMEIEILEEIKVTATADPLLVLGGTTQVTVTASGGSGNFVSGTGVFTRGSGTYSFTVTDDQSCSGTGTVEISDPQDFTVNVKTIGAINCPGGALQLQAIPAGGTAPYTYKLTGGNQATVSVTADPSIYIVGASHVAYVFEVTDANGRFSRSEPVVVSDPPFISLQGSSTLTSCAGEANGTATVVASHGNPSYFYKWNDAKGQTTATASGLAAGEYTVEVYDLRNCKPVTLKVIVSDPPVRSLTATKVDPNCPGANGTIQFTLTNVTDGFYNLLYDGGFFSAVQVNKGLASVSAPAGNYNNLRLSVNGCVTANGVSVTLNDPPKQVINEFISQPSCISPLGSVIVTFPANNTGFVYSINNLPYSASGSFSGLAPGVHVLKVKQLSTDCETTKSITLNSPPSIPTSPLADVTQPTCTVATGSIKVSSPAPGPGISYTLTGTNPVTAPVTNTTGQFSALPAGVYNLTTTNVSGCRSLPAVYTINASFGTPAQPVATVTPPDCDLATGTVRVNAPVAGFNYTLSGTNPVIAPVSSSTGIFNNVAPGSYELIVTNSSGCVSVPLLVVVPPQPPIPDQPTVTITQPDCTLATGSLQVITPAAAPGLTYTLSGSSPFVPQSNSSGLFTGLQPGDYELVVTNSFTCSSSPAPVTIDPQPAIPANLVAQLVPAECEKFPVQTLNANSGIVTVPAGVTVRWYDSAGNPVSQPILNSPGTVSYFAEAFNGSCASTGRTQVSLTILPATPVLVKQNPYAECAKAVLQTLDAKSVVSVPSGVTINWYDQPVGGTKITNTSWNQIGTKVYYAETFNGQCPSPVRTPITLILHALPETPVAEVAQAPTCKDEKGAIRITKPLGSNYEYSLNGGTFQSSPLFENLSSNSYTIVAKDISTGCDSKSSVIVMPPVPPAPVMKSAVAEDCLCYDGLGSINFVFENVADGTYVIVYLGGEFRNVEVLNNLAKVPAKAGTYDILAIEANGCTSAENRKVVISQPERLIASADITKIDLKSQQQGEIALDISGGTGIYDIRWSAVPALQFAGASTATIVNLKDGDYPVTIKDANGCEFNSVYTIPAPNLPPVATNDEFYTKCGEIRGDLIATDNGNGVDYDPDNDPFYINVNPTANPLHGQLTIYPDGTFIYQADRGYSGDDSFRYILTDSDNNLSKPATVLIHIISDFDGDGIADDVDPDADGDGILNVYEVMAGQDWKTTDTDGDGLPNYLDIDADGDGIVDNIEAQSSANYITPAFLDVNNNGVDDAYDPFQFTAELKPVDTDGDGLPDFLDVDSDNDLVPDYIEGHDLNADGKPDVYSKGKDSDNDGLDDAYDNVLNDCNSLENAIGSNAPLQDFDGDGAEDWRDDNDDNDQYPTRFEDLNADGDYSNDDMDFDGHPEYLDYGRDCDLMIPNAFSPNGDNIHEYFQIYCIDHFPNAEMFIFDSAGNKLFEKKNYGNLDFWKTPEQAWWDGKTTNRQLAGRTGKVPPGTYYYVLKLGNGEVKKSFVFVSY